MDQGTMKIFDLKRITLGNVISIGAMLATVFVSYTNLVSKIEVMQNDILWIKKTISNDAKSNRSVSTTSKEWITTPNLHVNDLVRRPPFEDTILNKN